MVAVTLRDNVVLQKIETFLMYKCVPCQDTLICETVGKQLFTV